VQRFFGYTNENSEKAAPRKRRRENSHSSNICAKPKSISLRIQESFFCRDNRKIEKEENKSWRVWERRRIKRDSEKKWNTNSSSSIKIWQRDLLLRLKMIRGEF
jgi:hypothetical protein